MLKRDLRVDCSDRITFRAEPRDGEKLVDKGVDRSNEVRVAKERGADRRRAEPSADFVARRIRVGEDANALTRMTPAVR
jgi:hypothetical protein